MCWAQNAATERVGGLSEWDSNGLVGGWKRGALLTFTPPMPVKDGEQGQLLPGFQVDPGDVCVLHLDPPALHGRASVVNAVFPACVWVGWGGWVGGWKDGDDATNVPSSDSLSVMGVER